MCRLTQTVRLTERKFIMASCNGCDLIKLKKKYGDRLIKFRGSWYLKNEQPGSGQIENSLPDGTPIRFAAWFMSEGHCDCYLPLHERT